jgi:hypothetical protein
VREGFEQSQELNPPINADREEAKFGMQASSGSFTAAADFVRSVTSDLSPSPRIQIVHFPLRGRKWASKWSSRSGKCLIH